MDKACPVIVRRKDCLEILAFKHPQAGLQIIKGTIEPNETLETACERELFEESGIRAKAVSILGECHIQQTGATWGFCEMQTDNRLPDSFSHYTEDGGGLTFEFIWCPILQISGEEWHGQYIEAVNYINRVLFCRNLQP